MTPEQIITEALDNYESLLISYAREITGELESAKDAVQETFLRLSGQRLDVLQPRLRPWLFVVCRNCALDRLLLSRYEAKELKALLRDFEGGGDDDLLTTLLKDEIKMRGCKVVKKTHKKKVRK
jgi:DNA-directed RNA polymerase specialized sigma24 family protein